MIYELFIGRWQPLHLGHRTIINKVLDEGKNVLIMCRETGINEKNPFTFEERVGFFLDHYQKEIQEGRMKIISIPDIASVNIGRKVGYDIVQHTVDEETANISATSIREAWGDQGGKVAKG